jgi:hypothetical protein
MNSQQQGNNMRFEKRFGNGYWGVFDTHRYAMAELVWLERDVVDAVDAYNLDYAAWLKAQH